MDVVFDRVAGLDIGKASVTVCVRTPGPGGNGEVQTRTFRTMTRSLTLMADWLEECGVELAAMGSTATYWNPVFYCLEEQMECWLLNAAHMKAVPVRKTDVKDAEWIAQLLEHGAGTAPVHPPTADPPVPENDPASGLTAGRPHPGRRPVGETAGGRLDQAQCCRLHHHGNLLPADARRAPGRGTRPGGDGRNGAEPATAQDPRAARGADGTVR